MACTFPLIKKDTSHWFLFRMLFLAHASSQYILSLPFSAGQRTGTLRISYTLRPDQPFMLTLTVYPKHLIYTPGLLNSIIAFVLI